MCRKGSKSRAGLGPDASQLRSGIGYPTARNFRFSNVRLNGAKAVVVGTEVSALKPVEGLVLTNITGTCSAGLTLANMKGVVLKDIKVTGFTGPLLGINNVTGTGLEGA